jgi:hypothetical protein
MSKRKLPQKSSDSSTTLDPKVGIGIIGLFSLITGDEESSEGNEEYLLDALSQISLFDDFADEDFEQLSDQVFKLFKEEDHEELIAQAIDSLPDDSYREAAYVTTILALGADEEVPEAEEEYIAELQSVLRISDERAQELIDEIYGEYDDEDEEEEEEEE